MVLDEAVRKIFPFQNRFFEVGNGCRLHYIDEGQGPTVLLLHSCPFWIVEFRQLINELRKDHRVVAIDQMGFGLSDKPRNFDYRIETHADHLERFIHELGLPRMTLLFHGRGAAIAMAVAVRHPDIVNGIVALNSMAFSDYQLPLRLQMCRLKWLGAKIIMNLNIFQRDINRLPREIRSAYLYPLLKKSNQHPVIRFIEDIPCAPEEPSAQTMFEIEAALWLLRDKPACIIWGMKDWLYKIKCFRKWVGYFPHSEQHILEKAGRCITEDAADEIVSIVSNFLKKNGI